ncbi:MAG: outer-membrane lipoprotein carrier protein LolA [Brevinematales bacterium]|nr:outer-membrane lipoprotein carrier protein LolA [Brevinematales bacterium]
MKRWIGMLFFLPVFVFSQEKISVNVLLQKIQNYTATVRTFTATFVYVVNKKTYQGVLYYKAPSKFAMEYSSGNRMLSDGKVLWIVIKDQNIAIRENLEKTKNVTPLTGWNIQRLQKEYIPFLPKEYTVIFRGKPAYRIEFKPKSTLSAFRYIELVVSTEGQIQRMVARNQLGREVQLELSYTGMNVSLGEDRFLYEPDENTYIFDDILISTPSES